MNQCSLTTRLGEYINRVLPAAHGHQQKAIYDFVLALDWTIEDSQHLLVASLNVGRRAVPLYWRAYAETELKKRMSCYERAFVRELFDAIPPDVARRRFILTADRWFADVDLLDVLNELGISYIIRTKSNYHVRVADKWSRLDSLRWTTNQRRRAWGRVWYCEGDPRHLFLVQARSRNKQGRWGIWHLLSNRTCRHTPWRRSTRGALLVKKGFEMRNDCSVLQLHASGVSRRGHACSRWWRLPLLC